MAEASGESQPSPAEAAIAYEEGIASEAAKVWADMDPEAEGYLTPGILTRLYPLLSRPIPPAFIEEVPAQKGKPYASTGVRSVQVQIDRLNNVLGPANWRDNSQYADDGRVCLVTVSLLGLPVGGENGNRDREILVSRSSYGGVDHASSRGNFYKGSYTNAAKVAIARLGPGHEIYVGVPDLDPDVSKEMAKDASGKTDDDEKPKAQRISAEEVENLRKLWRKSGVDEKAWRTFLTSRRRRDVSTFDSEDLAAAIAFLSEHSEEEEKPSE